MAAAQRRGGRRTVVQLYGGIRRLTLAAAGGGGCMYCRLFCVDGCSNASCRLDAGELFFRDRFRRRVAARRARPQELPADPAFGAHAGESPPTRSMKICMFPSRALSRRIRREGGRLGVSLSSSRTRV